MKKRQLIIILGIIILLAISIGLMAVFSGMKEISEPQEPKEHIRVLNAQLVEYKNINPKFTKSGRVESKQRIALSSEVSGKVLSGNIPLKKGQTFKKGDLLLRIYDQNAELNLQALKSRFLNSLANILPDIKIDYPNSYMLWADFFDAIKIDKKIPELPRFLNKQEKIFLASRNILNDYYTIQSQEILLEKYEIFAPFTGCYTSVNAEVGAIANPGVQLAGIIQTDILEIEVPVEVEHAKLLKKGMNAEIYTTTENENLSGKISRKANFVDPATQSISVFVEFKNQSKNPVFQGEYLKVEFEGIQIDSVMEIPRSGLVNFDQVYTVENSKLLLRNIEIIRLDEKTALIKGLPEGIEVVTEALLNAVENTTVETISN